MNKVIAITIILLTMACGGYEPVERLANAKPIYMQAGQSNSTPIYAPYLIDAFESATGAKIINCALSATLIQQWQPGSPSFNFCVDLIRLNTMSGEYYLDGIIWGQGESNAVKGVTYLFSDLTLNTLNGFRHALGDVRIVVPQIGIVEDGRVEAGDWELIQLAQLDAVAQLDDAFIFNTESFAVLEDWVHNDGDTDRLIGELIAGYF